MDSSEPSGKIPTPTDPQPDQKKSGKQKLGDGLDKAAGLLELICLIADIFSGF
jgi:hypothetical protein